VWEGSKKNASSKANIDERGELDVNDALKIINSRNHIINENIQLIASFPSDSLNHGKGSEGGN